MKIKEGQDLKVIEWISDSDFWVKQNDTFQRHQKGTGKWFLSDPKFLNWVYGNTNVLWCPGDGMVHLFILILC
jgi:hypothetical protein